jgi:hypothetical protein
MEQNEEGCGWVVKAPYTTNSEFVRFPKTLEQIKQHLCIAKNKYFGSIPYMLLQPCMENRKEYKVVVLNENPVYVSYNPKNSGSKCKSFSKSPHEELFQFARSAVQKLKFNCPESILDGLVRVDIFQNKAKQFVVNEFESLDAAYSANEGNMVKDSLTFEFLVLYWYCKIRFCIENLKKN